MDTLHKHEYSIETAMCSLVPSTGPGNLNCIQIQMLHFDFIDIFILKTFLFFESLVLCRDEMEEWSASEANLFEEALDKYGKDFTDIRQDYVSSTYRTKIFFQFFFSENDFAKT